MGLTQTDAERVFNDDTPLHEENHLCNMVQVLALLGAGQRDLALPTAVVRAHTPNLPGRDSPHVRCRTRSGLSLEPQVIFGGKTWA